MIRNRRFADMASTSDDDGTLFDDVDSFYSHSDSSVDSFESRSSWELPTLRLDESEAAKPVYERWSIRWPEDDNAKKEMVMFSHAATQSDLATMHLRAVEEFQVKQRRNWGARLFRCRRKTYEQELDERCKQLPFVIRDTIFNLLATRGGASSTPFRKRTWTVVVMSEHERHRFANPELAEVKRHKFRTWKNKTCISAELREYFFVIRGSEKEPSTESRTLARFDPYVNPWRDVDRAELSRRAHTRHIERIARRQSRLRHPPPYPRNRSPVSDSSDDETTCRRPQRRRVVLRPRRQSIPPRVPSPPPTAPPPAVTRYYEEAWERRPMTPPPAPRSPSPFRPAPTRRPWVTYEQDDIGYLELAQPSPPEYNPAPFTPYAPEHFGVSSCDPSERFSTFPEATSCPACRERPLCGHWNQGAVCYRPIEWQGPVATHPPCFACASATSNPTVDNPSRTTTPGYWRSPTPTTEFGRGLTRSPETMPFVDLTAVPQIRDYFDDEENRPVDIIIADDRSDSVTANEEDDGEKTAVEEDSEKETSS